MIKSPQPDMLLGWMGSLADPTRLRLLRLLERHELGVVELCEILQLPQSTVSRHLKVLADQRWVNSRRQGTTHLYRTILDELDPAARRLWLLAREQTEDWATYAQDQLRLTRLLAERRGDSEAFFAGAAAQWDKLRGELYGEMFSNVALLNLIPPDWVVSDLGCGTGQVTQQLASIVKQVIAVDNSPAMLKAARRRLGDAANVELRRGDLQALPMDDSTCDAALMLLALTYVTDAPVAVREMARVLKPGGRVIIVDLLPHDRDDFRRQMEQQVAGLSPEQLTDWMTTAGFADITVRPLPPEPDAKGPALFVATGRKPS
jgi:ArsR family transcriptional regulator